MSFSTTQSLPAEILYAYALAQRYDKLNENGTIKGLKVVMPLENLEMYSRAFVAYYQAKFHEEMIIIKHPEINFNHYEQDYENNTNFSIINKMIKYNPTDNTLSTTDLFDPRFIMQNYTNIITADEKDILNKKECVNIATAPHMSLTHAEQYVFDYQYAYYKNFDEKSLRKELTIYKTILQYHKSRLDKVIYNTYLESGKTLAKSQLKEISQNLMLLSENIPLLSRIAHSLTVCQGLAKNKTTKYNYDIAIKDYKKTISQEIAKVLKERKMDYNPSLINDITQQLVLLSSNSEKIERLVSSCQNSQVRINAISSLLPVKQIKKQIGDNTPNKKVIKKYDSLKKHRRIISSIVGEENTRPINEKDKEIYLKSKKETQKQKTFDGVAK